MNKQQIGHEMNIKDLQYVTALVRKIEKHKERIAVLEKIRVSKRAEYKLSIAGGTLEVSGNVENNPYAINAIHIAIRNNWSAIVTARCELRQLGVNVDKE